MSADEVRDDQQPGGDTTELTCQELVELVTSYCEGQLPQPERARFEAHLATCPPCETYVEQVDMTVRALGGLDAQSVQRVEEDSATQELLKLFRAWKAERQP